MQNWCHTSYKKSMKQNSISPKAFSADTPPLTKCYQYLSRRLRDFASLQNFQTKYIKGARFNKN